MKKYFLAKLITLIKTLEIIAKLLGGTLIFVLSVIGVFKITNIKYEVTVPPQIFYLLLSTFFGFLLFYIILKGLCNQSISQWHIVTKVLEDQITYESSNNKSEVNDPQTDSLPRGARLDFALARSFLSEMQSKPFLKLKLNPRISDSNIRMIAKNPIRIKMINPGMHKTYLIITGDVEDGGIFFIDCENYLTYERDYAYTIYGLLFPILSSATNAISKEYIDSINDNPEETRYFQIYSYRLIKKGRHYILEIPII